MSGKKINCPKCSASIKVPEAVPAPKAISAEDDWLGLDDPSPAVPSVKTAPATPASLAKTAPAQPPAASQPAATQPAQNSSNRAQTPIDLDNFDLASLDDGGPGQGSPDNANVDDGDLLLAPLSSPTKPSNTETKNSSSTNKSTSTSSNEKRSEGADSSKKETRPSLFDDDLPELAPMDVVDIPRAPTAKGSASTSADLDLDDLTLEPVSSEPVVKKPATRANENGNKKATSGNTPSNAGALVSALDQLSLDQNALAELLSVKTDEEFRFPCKVCGSALYASESRVGTTTRCPDCFSEFSIPSPPPKKKTKQLVIDETTAAVSLAPIDSKSMRDENIDVKKSKELLDKAAEAVEREQAELNELSSSFDSQRWLNLAFGFLRDPMVILASVALGVFTACWLGAMAAMGPIVKLEVGQAIIVRIVIFAVFCIPILGSTCLIALAILPMAANRLRRIEDWPFGKIAESFGELMMVTLSIVVASIPGGMTAASLNAAGAHPAVCIAFLMISIWFIAPILLLSMIENGSIVEPYAPAVLKSMKSRSDAWGGMYMQTAMIMFAIYAFTLIAMGNDLTGDFLLGFTFPFFCFMIANQLGLLAGRISDVTDMGFQGDFSDD